MLAKSSVRSCCRASSKAGNKLLSRKAPCTFATMARKCSLKAELIGRRIDGTDVGFGDDQNARVGESQQRLNSRR